MKWTRKEFFLVSGRRRFCETTRCLSLSRFIFLFFLYQSCSPIFGVFSLIYNQANNEHSNATEDSISERYQFIAVIKWYDLTK